MEELTKGWKVRRTEGLMGWKDGRLESWKDGWKCGRMEG